MFVFNGNEGCVPALPSGQRWDGCIRVTEGTSYYGCDNSAGCVHINVVSYIEDLEEAGYVVGLGSVGGLRRCPLAYRYSDEGAKHIYDCYNRDEEGKRHYYPFYCKKGKFAAVDGNGIPYCLECKGDMYYCPGGCFEMPHTNTVPQGQYDCPAGYTCYNGERTPCPDGTVKPYAGAGECIACDDIEYASAGILCKQCPLGYWCADPDKPHVKQPCPEGHYCLGAHAYLCELGTYSDGGAIFEEEDCATGKCAKICEDTSSSISSGGSSAVSDNSYDEGTIDSYNTTAYLEHFCGISSTSSESSNSTPIENDETESSDSTHKDCTNLCNSKTSISKCKDEDGYPRPKYVIKETFPVITCKSCPAGTYGKIDNDGIPRCEDCPSGTYNPDIGATSIEACKPSVCGANQYRDMDNGGVCTYCPAGQVVNDAQDGCYECPIGEAPSDGKCVKCDETEYTEEAGTPRCIQCPNRKIATYTWNEDGTERVAFTGCVLPCPSGYINVTEAVGEYCAKLCDGGYGWVQTDSRGSCEKCPDGTYRSGDDTHNALCQNCPTGTFSFGPGKEKCETCPPGYCCIENTVEGRVIAERHQCNRGTYSTGQRPADGAKDGNYYCKNDVQGMCYSCADGTTTVNKGAKGCDECVPTVAKYCLGPNSEICFSWPTKINIYQNDINRQNMTIPPLEGNICSSNGQ